MSKRRHKAGDRARKRSSRIFVWSAVLGLAALVILLIVAGMMDPRGSSSPDAQAYVDDSQ